MYKDFISSKNKFNLNINKPIIFMKKVNNISKTIPLKYVVNNIGQTRHYPPASQEWYNSVYSYNNNYIKLLPSADNNLMNLLKSYHSMYYGKELNKTVRMKKKNRRLSLKKILIGKGQLKHTSNKIVIT